MYKLGDYNMNQKKQAFTQRVALNSKNYHPKDLFDMNTAASFLELMQRQFKLETLMTDRHGVILMEHGSFQNFVPDVVNKPGIKIRVQGRTVCHVYAKYDNVDEKDMDIVKGMLDAYIRVLEGFSGKSYLCSEQAMYIDELEQELEKEDYQVKYAEQNDPLTGVLTKNYFNSRMKELKDMGVVPTGVMIANINDARFALDRYGEEESDRLITTVADILKKNADATTVIGRVEPDVFYILLPNAEEADIVNYKEKIQEACDSFEDDIIAPSIAVGYVIRTNVEEDFKALFSDAEYEMLENKYQIKNSKGYQERLRKGLNLANS